MQRRSTPNPLVSSIRGWTLVYGCFIGPMTAGPFRLQAQEVFGVVRDSVTKRPVAGAVVTVRDGGGTGLARVMTDQMGRYRAAPPASGASLRLVRIGFRPTSVVLRKPPTMTDTIDVLMAPIPTLLETVSVRANSTCPKRDDEGAALGLLEQARATLLNTIVARESNPASMVRLGFVRSMDGTSDHITWQAVRVDSAARASASFQAVQSAADFVRSGFARDAAGGGVFFAPDADVLLDDAFVAGYCFRLVSGDRDHPTEVGLAFAAPRRAPNRIDIAGTLWADTSSRRLRQMEFRYVGLDHALDAAKPGGWLSFRDMPNGIVIIDRWSLRLPVLRADSTPGGPHEYTIRTWVEAQESGGEVARMSLSAQSPWDAPLGALRAHALMNDGQPATNIEVWLEDTDYRATTDATGHVSIDHLLPGPYKLSVIEPRLAVLGITLATSIRFNAVRDSVHQVAFEAPTAEDYVSLRCRRDGIWKEPPPNSPRPIRIVGRAFSSNDHPAEGVTVMLTSTQATSAITGPGSAVRSTATGSDGIFQLCPTAFRTGDSVRVELNRHGSPSMHFVQRLTDSLVVLPPVRIGPP
jgi:hypothetical protein